MQNIDITHFHLFSGSGAGAKGFNKGHARVGLMQARFRCLGGVDVDPAAVRDFQRLTGTPGTVLDMFSREQYIAFHGVEPPAGWREAVADDIRRAAGGQRPNIVFLSAPCKSFSGLLPQRIAITDKYQALSGLTLRGVWLMLEAWRDDPPELVVFENVPRIASRGRHLLDQIVALLRAYGYAVAETTHDCGELGGLAQSRKRFLLVARHQEKVPAFLYEPTRRPLRAVGDILGRMPLPGDPAGGPMHRVPSLQWKTWVRLAFVKAGSDWRSLRDLNVQDGVLADYLIVPEYRGGYLGVTGWDETAKTIAGRSQPTNNGCYSVADPRFDVSNRWNDGQAYGVRRWDEHTGTVTGQQSPGQGSFSVADPRGTAFGGKYRITEFDKPAGTVISGSTTGQGAFAVADPRHHGPEKFNNQYRIIPWENPCGAVTSATGKGQCVADPRPAMDRQRGDHYLTGGHYGVVPWTSPSGAVSAAACHDNGPWSVADPRVTQDAAGTQAARLPAERDRLVARIRALDGTWHRPFTTLELAALQGLMEPEEYLELDGLSDSAWRERIGNAVPPPAAAAIASVMGETLLLARAGETFQLSATPVWVRPVAIALTIHGGLS